VLAIDQTYRVKDDDKAAENEIKTATLEVMPEQSEALARAEGMDGKLSLALRSIADHGSAKNGDNGPQLAENFSDKKRKSGKVRIIRYGVSSIVTSAN
jgi:Flp pilus assembly protein CpaB